MVNVPIVDDSLISRGAFERQLEASGRYRVVASIANAANAEIACLQGNVTLVPMDICTADHESCLVAAASIKRHWPQTRVVMMTSMPEHTFLEKARAGGADGFWYKELGMMSVIGACDRVMAGGPSGQTVRPRFVSVWRAVLISPRASSM